MKKKVPNINVIVRTLKSGKRSYFLDYRLNGVRKLEKAGDTKSEAEIYKAMRVTEFKNEKFELISQSVGVRDLLARYLASKNNYISTRSLNRYRVLFDAFSNFIESYFKSSLNDCSQIAPAYILKFIDYCITDLKWEPATINMARSHLNAAFNFGIKSRLTSVNPFSEIKNLPTVQKTKVQFYSTEELQLIFKNLDHFWGSFFKVLYLTGMRKDELTNLKWENVSFDQEQITVTSDDTFTTKSKRSRVVPMHPEVVKILKARKGKHKVYCFTTPKAGTMIGINKPYNAIKKVLDKLGLEGDVHKFRHTFASHLVMAGESIETVSNLLGHSKIETTQIYAHLSPNFKSNAVSKLILPI